MFHIRFKDSVYQKHYQKQKQKQSVVEKIIFIENSIQ